MSLGDLTWCGMDWIVTALDSDQWKALVNMIMKLRVPRNAGYFLSSRTTDYLSNKAHLHAVSS
jgi:hypothetical protein